MLDPKEPGLSFGDKLKRSQKLWEQNHLLNQQVSSGDRVNQEMRRKLVEVTEDRAEYEEALSYARRQKRHPLLRTPANQARHSPGVFNIAENLAQQILQKERDDHYGPHGVVQALYVRQKGPPDWAALQGNPVYQQVGLVSGPYTCDKVDPLHKSFPHTQFAQGATTCAEKWIKLAVARDRPENLGAAEPIDNKEAPSERSVQLIFTDRLQKPVRFRGFDSWHPLTALLQCFLLFLGAFPKEVKAMGEQLTTTLSQRDGLAEALSLIEDYLSVLDAPRDLLQYMQHAFFASGRCLETLQDIILQMLEEHADRHEGRMLLWESTLHPRTADRLPHVVYTMSSPEEAYLTPLTNLMPEQYGGGEWIGLVLTGVALKLARRYGTNRPPRPRRFRPPIPSNGAGTSSEETSSNGGRSASRAGFFAARGRGRGGR